MAEHIFRLVACFALMWVSASIMSFGGAIQGDPFMMFMNGVAHLPVLAAVLIWKALER